MFTAALQQRPVAQIANELKTKGYCLLPNALDLAFLDRMVGEFGPNEVAVNRHELATVCMGRTWYLNQVLGRSKAAYDLITSDKVLDVGAAALGEKFRLATKRYYTTREGAKMAWHRDNKDDPERTIQVEGLIWIFYLTDVTEGAFQFIEGSHAGESGNDQANFTDEYIDRAYRDRIITCEAPRGFGIVYNIRMIHRAKPFAGIDYQRSSLFFGQMAEPTLAEPVLVNTSFIDNLDERRKYYLGFGKREIAPAFPSTSVTTMDDQTTTRVLSEITQYAERIGVAPRSALAGFLGGARKN